MAERYDGTERPVPVLDAVGPYAGSCWICGFGDKRHRVADGIVGAALAGDTPEAIADDYGVTESAITALIAYADESRRRRRHRWEVRA